MFGQQFYDSANADLFVVVENLEPASEFVGALNVSRDRKYYAIDSIMRRKLYFPQWATPCEPADRR
jgi:hypothetical protein